MPGENCSRLTRSRFRTSIALLKNSANESQTALARYSKQKDVFVPITTAKHGVWGIMAKNKQQQFALDLLLNDDIRLVTLVGKAGTGKTLLALAAGLEKTIEARTFQRLVVSRPVFPMGKDIGFLPGDVEEKLRPWMQPIRDNLDFLVGSSGGPGRVKGKKDLQSLFDLGMIEVEPLTYIRGRSMPNQYLIVDEAQNLTPARDQDHHYPRGRRDQGRADRRPVPDRQSLHRLVEQRSHLRGRSVQGRAHCRAHHAGEGRAFRSRGACGDAVVRLQCINQARTDLTDPEMAGGTNDMHRGGAYGKTDMSNTGIREIAGCH